MGLGFIPAHSCAPPQLPYRAVTNAGRGLRAGEICTLKGQDVRVGHDGVLLFPHGYRGAGPREVPLLKTHIESLQAVINSTVPDDYLFRPGRDNEHVGQLSPFCAG